MEVTILGRGKSLEKLEDFKTNFDKVILVNEFWKSGGNPCDYYKEPTVSNFITGKEITLVGTPAMGDAAKMTQGIEADHNVKNKFSTVWAMGSGTDRDRLPCSNWKTMPEECLESYKYTRLNEALRSVDMIGYGPLRGSLAMAILVAIDYFKADTVNIFGLDFYELDYLVKQNYNYENEKTQCKAIKEDFTTLFNHFKDIQFNVFTLANFEPNLDNVTVS